MCSYFTIDFVDDYVSNIYAWEIVSTTKDLMKLKASYDEIFIALGDNELRYSLINECKEIRYTIVTLIDSQSFVSKDSKIEMGTVVFPIASIGFDAKVEIGSIVSSISVIYHNSRIGRSALKYAYCVIMANKSFEAVKSNTLVGDNKYSLEVKI